MKKDTKIYTRGLFVWCGALLSSFLWGSAFPVIKLGYKAFSIGEEDMGTQILFAGIRFFLAGIMAIVFGCILQRRLLLPKRQNLQKVFHLSLLQTVAQYVFFYIGLAHTSGVRASIVEGTNVFVAIVVASLLFKQEKLTMQKMLGCCIGFLGVIFVNLTGGSLGEGSLLMGDLLIMLSTVAYAFSSVLLKEYSKVEEPVILSGYQFMVGGAVMIAAGLCFGGTLPAMNTQGFVYLIYLAFVSAAAYSLWGVLMKYNPISRIAVFGFMTPVFGVILSVFLLGEKDSLGIMHMVSLLLVCVGIYIVHAKKKEKGAA